VQAGAGRVTADQRDLEGELVEPVHAGDVAQRGVVHQRPRGNDGGTQPVTTASVLPRLTLRQATSSASAAVTAAVKSGASNSVCSNAP